MCPFKSEASASVRSGTVAATGEERRHGGFEYFATGLIFDRLRLEPRPGSAGSDVGFEHVSSVSWSFPCRGWWWWGGRGDVRPSFIYASGFAALAQLAITQQRLHKHQRFRRTAVSQQSSPAVEVLSNMDSTGKGRGNEIQLPPRELRHSPVPVCPHKPSSMCTDALCLHEVSASLHPPYIIRFLMQLNPGF